MTPFSPFDLELMYAANLTNRPPAGPSPASQQDPQHPPQHPPTPQARPDPAASGRSDAPAGLPPPTCFARISAEVLRGLLREGTLYTLAGSLGVPPTTHEITVGLPVDAEIVGARFDADRSEVVLDMVSRTRGSADGILAEAAVMTREIEE